MAEISHSRFEYEEGDIRISACVYCKHVGRAAGHGYNKCAAFPGGIPQGILSLENDHMYPIDGDNGIQFEPKAGWDVPKRLQR